MSMFIENAIVTTHPTGNHQLELSLSNVSYADIQQINNIFNTTRHIDFYKKGKDIYTGGFTTIPPKGFSTYDDWRDSLYYSVRDMYPTITFTNNKAEVNNMADFKAIDKAYGEGYEDGKKHAKTWCKDECLYIKKVIFNNPATIVFWSDGTKTVAKAHGKDKFDKEIGLTVCIAKRALKNKKKWDEVFKKWIKE